MIHRLLNKMQALAKDVPSDSEWLFGDDLNKRINNIRRTGSAVTSPSYQNQYHFQSYNRGTATGNQNQNPKTLQPSWRSSAQEKD